MMSKKETGRHGEALARRYLEGIGYRILDTNWHAGHCELDIVAMDNAELVIVEVKTRRDTRFGNPDDAVNPLKISRLITAAEAYIERKKLDCETRFDVISIVRKGRDEYSMEHIKDAFYPTAEQL
ncbi:MAG: YraN family protein [Bacteroidales bacterium]|jgi:putative endonuclease|nr:YraN family protein [Bacteroidales bacterium]